MANRGRPKGENSIVRKLSVRFPEKEYEEMSEYAKKHNLSVGQVIRSGVQLYMGNAQK